jgi:uncharacterized protein with ParB-like and HNH nuclease domain
MEDLIELHEMSKIPNPRFENEHFFGIMICLTIPYSRDLAVIDGQQRLVTTALLLAALRDVLNSGEVESERDTLEVELDEMLLIRHEGSPYLKLVERDHPAYQAIVYRERIPDEYEESSIVKNYEYFKERMLDLEMTVDQFMECLRRLYIVPVILDNRENDAQKVFESINSTGLNLTEGDKIRNYMLMGYDDSEQENYYDRYWVKIDDGTIDMTDFIRDYLTAVTGTVPSFKNVYSSFKIHTKKEKRDDESFEKLFKELLRYSRYYKYIESGNLDRISKKASMLMYRINHQQTTVVYPFLMRILDCHESGFFSTKEVEEILSIVENYILRRALCRFPSSTLGWVFRNLFQTLVKDDSEDLIEKLKYDLLEREGSAEYPRDDIVRLHLSENNLYSNYTACTHALAVMEHASRDTVDTLKRITDKELTVEHVMPQRLPREWIEHLGYDYKEIHEKWLHKIGNLTLTAYNSSYSNRSYEFKRDLKETGFKESRLWLNRMMAENEKWTDDVMKERNELLVERFLEVMPEFNTTYEPPILVDGLIIRSLDMDDDMFRNVVVSGFVFDNVTYVASSGIDAYVQMLKMFYDLDPVKFRNYVKNKEDDLWMRIDFEKAEEWNMTEIGSGIWTFRNMGNITKAKFLRGFSALYGFELNSMGFIAKKRGS